MHTTFADVYKTTEKQATTMLVRKAWIASRLAKYCHGRNQRLLYRAKYRALSQAVATTPELFRPIEDAEDTGLVLLRFFGQGESLYAPIAMLTQQVQNWIAGTWKLPGKCTST